MIAVEAEPPRQPDVARLIAALDRYVAGLYPAESNHLLDLDALCALDVRLFVARSGGEAVGCGALRSVDHRSRLPCPAMFASYSISRDELESVIREAVATANDGGREICGLLLARGRFLSIERLRNRRRRGGSWAFYARDVRRCVIGAQRGGANVVGTFHSHPVGFPEPGASDIAGVPDDSLMLVIDCIDRECGLWHIHSGKARRLRIVRQATGRCPDGREVPPGQRRGA